MNECQGARTPLCHLNNYNKADITQFANRSRNRKYFRFDYNTYTRHEKFISPIIANSTVLLHISQRHIRNTNSKRDIFVMQWNKRFKENFFFCFLAFVQCKRKKTTHCKLLRLIAEFLSCGRCIWNSNIYYY